MSALGAGAMAFTKVFGQHHRIISLPLAPSLSRLGYVSKGYFPEKVDIHGGLSYLRDEVPAFHPTTIKLSLEHSSVPIGSACASLQYKG